jgi:translation initiation factor 6 (eIF-6)
MDVSFVIDQQSVSFLVAQITNIGGLVTITDNNLVFVGNVTGDSLQVIAKDTNLNIINATYTLVGNVLTLSNIQTGLANYLLNQDGTFLLQQDNSKLVIT